MVTNHIATRLRYAKGRLDPWSHKGACGSIKKPRHRGVESRPLFFAVWLRRLGSAVLVQDRTAGGCCGSQIQLLMDPLPVRNVHVR